MNSLLQNGLLGMGGIGGMTPQPGGLLGQYYDPDAARKATLKNMLIMGGLGLAGDGWQGAARGAGLAAMETPKQFRDMAMDAYSMDRQSKSDQWQEEKMGWERDQRNAMNSLLEGVNDPLARAFPEQYAEMQFNQRYGQREERPKPAAIQEYEYAKQQGFPGTFQDWEASKRGGMNLSVDPQTGQVTFQQGANIKPMTEGQSKDTSWAVRAEGALQAFEPVSNALTSLPSSIGSQVPYVGNYLKGGGYQKAEQAAREFLAPILRKDSGGAVTPEEIVLYGEIYIPAPGDGPEVLSAKKAARRRSVDALKAGMTPQAILAMEQGMAASGGAQQPGLTGGADPLSEARAAIAAGADPNAVKQRLQQMGIDPSGL